MAIPEFSCDRYHHSVATLQDVQKKNPAKVNNPPCFCRPNIPYHTTNACFYNVNVKNRKDNPGHPIPRLGWRHSQRSSWAGPDGRRDEAGFSSVADAREEAWQWQRRRN